MNEPCLIAHSLSGGKSLPILQFSLLWKEPWLCHAVTTRKGGVSEGPFESLNLSFTRGDKREAVEENYRRVASFFQVTPNQFVMTRQVHHTNVARVTKEEAGNGVTVPNRFEDMDGLITDVPNLVLGTMYADCVPLLFADPVHRAVGVSHSGWRGTAARMGEVTLKRMWEEFGTKPEDVLCAIGPSIGRECYEVDGPVAEAFRKAFLQTDSFLFDKGNGHYQLDLWEANRTILMEAGVPKKNIAVTDLCTACRSDLFYSHRKMGEARGNFGAFIMVKDS